MIADRQTHTQIQTDRLITILHSPTGGGVIISCYSNGSISSIASTAKTDSSIRQMPGGVNVHPQCTPPHLTHSTWANAANFCPKRHFNRFIRFCAVVTRMQKSFVFRCFSIRRNPPPSDWPLKFYNQETKRMKRKIKQRKYNLEDLSQVNISVIVSVDNTEARDRLKNGITASDYRQFMHDLNDNVMLTRMLDISKSS